MTNSKTRFAVDRRLLQLRCCRRYQRPDKKLHELLLCRPIADATRQAVRRSAMTKAEQDESLVLTDPRTTEPPHPLSDRTRTEFPRLVYARLPCTSVPHSG